MTAQHGVRALQRARRLLFGLVLAALLGCASAAPASSTAATAHLAGTISLNETGRLHLTSHHGFTLNEQGSASGTISGTIYIHLNVVSTNRVTAEVNIYPQRRLAHRQRVGELPPLRRRRDLQRHDDRSSAAAAATATPAARG